MTWARLGALLVPAVALVWAPFAPAAVAQDQIVAADRVLVILVPDASFEELLAIPEVQALARSGGAALMSSQGAGWTGNPIECGTVGRGTTAVEWRWICPEPGADLASVGPQIRQVVEMSAADRLLVVVTSPTTSDRMRTSGDLVHPFVMAVGRSNELLGEGGIARTLTSDSTRRPGVVSGLDLIPTIAAFFEAPPPADVTEEVVRVVDDPPPFDLHERYLAQRRMYVPIGTAAALYVTGAGLLAIAFLVRRRSVAVQWRRAAGWAALSVPMLATGLLAAGHLPELSYRTAIPMVAIVTVFGTLAFSPLEREDATLVPVGIGIAVLAFFVLEAAIGWTAMMTPLLGGSQLDGGRFYGLPNVAIGLLVGASMWIAQRLSTSAGVALTCIVALFAGLPFVGMNLGGAVTLFAAAGLWLAVRERARLGVWRGAAAFLGVTVLGSAVILVAHAFSPVATHVTRFEQQVDGIAGVLDRYVDRLQVGFDLIAGSPAALVPVLGLPAVLYVVLRPPAPIRSTFERWPAWRDAVLVTVLAGFVAYLVNDSGPAAAGLAFGLALGGMIGVSLLAPTGKMEAP